MRLLLAEDDTMIGESVREGLALRFVPMFCAPSLDLAA